MHETLKLGRLSMILLCFAVAGSTSALAQGQTGGLYGATRANTGRDKLNLELWLGQAVTSGIPSEFRPFVQSATVDASQPSTLFAASGDYASNHGSVALFARASTFFRYGWDVNQLAAVSQDAELGADFRLPNRGHLTVTQTATYSPAYLYELFPTASPVTLGQAIPVTPAYRTHSVSYLTSVAATFGSPRGTQLTATAEHGVTNFDRQIAATRDLTTNGAGVQVSQALSRSAGIFAAYHYQTGDYSTGGTSHEQRLTLGADYSLALSVTRRAALHLEVSPSVVESPDLSGSVTRQSYFLGQARIEYPFRPKWRAYFSYDRSVNYAAGLSGPAVTNGVRAEANGIIAHRFDLTAMAGYATGSSAISGNYQNLGTSTGQVRLRYALSRTYALFTEYLYSSYDLGRQFLLGPDVPVTYHVQEFRVGFTAFMPVLGMFGK